MQTILRLAIHILMTIHASVPLFSGTPLPRGGEFQVNVSTHDTQRSPSVASGELGGFQVVWTSYSSDGSDTADSSIQGRRYDAAGDPIGSEIQINIHTQSFQRSPSVSGLPEGGFVVVWQSHASFGSDTDPSGISAQQWSPPLFSDGFESGHTGRWPSTQP